LEEKQMSIINENLVGGWSDRADDLINTINTICPDDTNGLGNDIRIIATSILTKNYSWRTTEAMLNVCEEYAAIIDRTQRELAEMDEWATRCEAEAD